MIYSDSYNMSNNLLFSVFYWVEKNKNMSKQTQANKCLHSR